MVDDTYVPGRNAEQIHAQASRVIRSKMPVQVRAELLAAVRAGYLGRLPKDGLKPEIFFNPDHKHGAVDRQNREAAYSIGCIATVMHAPTTQEKIDAAFASLATSNPDPGG